MEKSYVRWAAPWGEMVAQLDSDGVLKGLWFDGQAHFPEAALVAVGDFEKGPKREAAHRLAEEIAAYAEGTLQQFSIPVAPEGTAFQKAVWQVLQTIPYGETWTYGEVAAAVAEATGRERTAPRAVGQAIARNPVSILIPCHRVVGKSGRLTGYAGGLSRKAALLRLESEA